MLTKVINTLENRRWIMFSLVVVAIIFAVMLRLQGLDNLVDKTNGEYLPTALDPFYFERTTEHLVDGGSINDVDNMRYLGAGTYSKELTSYANYVLYNIIKTFNPVVKLSYVVVISPVVYFALAMIIFFFFMSALFGNIVGGLTTMLLSFVPQLVNRTNVGFADHEAIGILFFFLALWVTVTKISDGYRMFVDKHNLVWVESFILIPVVMTLLMYAWGGLFKIYMILYPLIAISVILVLMWESRLNKGKIFKFSVQIVLMFTGFAWLNYILAYGFSAMSWQEFLRNYLFDYTAVFYLLMFLLALIIVFNYFIVRYVKSAQNIKFYRWVVVQWLTISVIAGIVTGKIWRVIQFIASPISKSRVGLTVAENQKILITEMPKHVGSFYTVMFIVAGVMLIYTWYDYYLKKKKGLWPRTMLYNIVIAVFYVVALYLANSSIRLVFVEIIFLTVIVGYVLNKFKLVYMLSVGKPFERINLVVILTVLMLTLFAIGSFYVMSNVQARYVQPSASYEWQKAMEWVRQNTNDGDIFVHWWDYGYWVQTMGRRPTVTDGGHTYKQWDHLIARYFLTTPYDLTAYKMFNTYNVSYVLLDPSDIGKYSAFSSIANGVDEDGNDVDDRLGFIGVFKKDDKSVQEYKNYTEVVYTGQQIIDEDYVVGTKLYSAYNSAIVMLKLKVSSEGRILTLKGILADRNGKTSEVYVRYIAVYDFNERKVKIYDSIDEIGKENETLPVYNGLVRFVVNEKSDMFGGAVMLTPRVRSGLFARMFITDEYDHNVLVPVYNGTEMFSNVGGLAMVNGQLYGGLRIYKFLKSGDFGYDDRFKRTTKSYANLDDLYWVSKEEWAKVNLS